MARLYHLHSSNVRSREIEVALDDDMEPLRFRTYPGAQRTALPGRDFALDEPLGGVLERRRSCRDFALRPLPIEALGRLLYASYGARCLWQSEGEWSLQRPVPSAGGRYPLEIYVATQAVEGLVDGIHHYDARAHALELRRPGVVQAVLADIAMGQEMIRDVNVVAIITAVRDRTMWKYGQRGYRFVFIDAGHLGQNMYLVATAMGLGPVTIGGFIDAELNELLRLPEGEEAVYLACVGQPRPGGGEPG